MIVWLKKYWFKALISLVAIILTSYLSSLATKFAYKKQIKELDTNISEMWQKIGDSKAREATWRESSKEHYALAMEKEKKLRKKDQEMRVKIAEKRELKKQIREMPATQVVIRTIEIINCPDIVQQEQGIVFTLDCAKDNLTFLEDSFSLKREVDDWKGQYSICLDEVADLKNVIIGKDGEIKEVKDQSVKKDGIIKKTEDKFNLSEKRGKQSYWKGLKTGAAVGGVIAFFAGFVLGK